MKSITFSIHNDMSLSKVIAHYKKTMGEQDEGIEPTKTIIQIKRMCFKTAFKRAIKHNKQG